MQKQSYVDKINSLQKVKSNKLSVGLFSGGGGLDLGLSFAGFTFGYANDLEPSCIKTLQHNFPECLCVAKSINDLTGDEIKKHLNVNQIELLAGGSPCQSFSVLGKRAALDDKIGQLVFEHIRLINELQPQAFSTLR